jgi:hypothetical protein
LVELEIGTLRDSNKPTRCACCHAPIGAAAVVCDRCGTQLHADCLAMLKTCPTLGCGELPLDLQKRTSRSWRKPIAVGLVVLAIVSYAMSPAHFIQHCLPFLPARIRSGSATSAVVDVGARRRG